MKATKLFFGMFATCALLTACSSDDNDGGGSSTSKATTAYMKVRLNDVGSGTRASDGGLEAGSTNEHAIYSADFYFFNSNGTFAQKGNTVNNLDGTESTGAVNVEFKSATVVALTNQTEATLPKYMVTIINKPESFSFTSGTITELLGMTSKSDIYDGGITITQTGGTNTDNTYFVMSTSSYFGGSNYYCVNELSSDNFILTTEDFTNDNASAVVDVYVERLAAKVTVDVDDEKLKAVDGTDGVYKVTTGTAGYEGDNYDYDETGEVYIKFNGWTLNGTSKQSLMMKNIETAWTSSADGLGFTWNDVNNFRSYWGKSVGYNKAGNYPTSYENYVNDKSSTNEFLNYTNLAGTLTALGGSEYCASNTNGANLVTNNFPTALTCVLVSAQLCDKNGTAVTDDYVEFGTFLYTEADFIKYVLKQLNLSVYAKTTGTPDTYTQISTDDVELKYTGYDGKMYIALTTAGEAKEWYSYSNSSYTETNTAAINASLLDGSDGAVGYKTGLMYYNIPIEHLRSHTENSTPTYLEGEYGVVRNHHYKLSITEVGSLGKGIYEPTETVIPNEDEVKRYKLGADINVLSWKIVNQEVSLN